MRGPVKAAQPFLDNAHTFEYAERRYFPRKGQRSGGKSCLCSAESQFQPMAILRGFLYRPKHLQIRNIKRNYLQRNKIRYKRDVTIDITEMQRIILENKDYRPPNSIT